MIFIIADMYQTMLKSYFMERIYSLADVWECLGKTHLINLNLYK
jgi:hypothetical protein